MKNRFSSLLILLSAVFLSVVLPVRGATVAPQRVQVKLAPGETETKNIRLTNEAEVEAQFSLSLESVELDVQGNMVKSSDDSPALTWIQGLSDTVSVPALQTVEVPLTVSVPTEALSGAYAVGVVVTPLLEAGPAPYQTLLLVTVSGALVPEVEITEFSAPKGVYAPGAQIPLKIELANGGNTHLVPSVVVDVYRGTDWVADLKVNEVKEVMLAGGTRVWNVSWNANLGFGKYALVVHVSGEDVEATSEPVYIWVVSWARVLPVVVALLILVIAAGVLLRHPARNHGN